MTQGKNEEIHFKRYYVLAKIEGSIKNLSPLRVGAGRGNRIGEPDLPIVRTPDRKAVIPGSSLKGIIRNNLARFLGYDVEKDLCYLFGCGGDNALGSSLIFGDFTTQGPIETVERSHIKINLSTGGVKNLFQAEYVPENNVFTGSIMGRNISLSDLSVSISIIAKLLNLGVVRIGGFKSRGYGVVNFDISKIQIMLPSDSIKYETTLGFHKGKKRQISITAKDKLIETIDFYDNKTTIKQEFSANLVSDLQLFKVYEIDVKSFYSAGDALLTKITNA